MNKNSYLIQLSESDRIGLGRIDFAEQTEPQKVFTAIWELESQVNNGGFDQYFRYVESASIAFAPVALRSIGATACAAVVAEAIAHVFGSAVPGTEEERSEALDALEGERLEKLSDLDQAFLAYPDNLTALLFAYVASHPEAFGAMPDGIE